MANRRYAKEWLNYDDTTTLTTVASDAKNASANAIISFNSSALQSARLPMAWDSSTTNAPSGLTAPGTVATITKTGTNAGTYQVAIADAGVRARKLGSNSTWGSWSTISATNNNDFIVVTDFDEIGDSDVRVTTLGNIKDTTDKIPAPRAMTNIAGTDYVFIWVDTTAECRKLRTVEAVSSTEHVYTQDLFYDSNVATNPKGFGVVDIQAVGFVDTSTTKWLAGTTNAVAKIHYLTDSVSITNNTNAVDGYNYGEPYESRVLEDGSSEFRLMVNLSDSADLPPDNRLSGSLKMVELGMKNSSGERMLLQLWDARCVSIERNFPEARFAYCEYVYRCRDFRWEIGTANQVVADF